MTVTANEVRITAHSISGNWAVALSSPVYHISNHVVILRFPLSYTNTYQFFKMKALRSFETLGYVKLSATHSNILEDQNHQNETNY
jgi:hypothetical protein